MKPVFAWKKLPTPSKKNYLSLIICDTNLSIIVSFLNFAERYAVRFTCKRLRNLLILHKLPDGTMNDVKVLFEERIRKRYFPRSHDHASRFLSSLNANKHYIFGSSPLQFILGESWQGSDLDVCGMCNIEEIDKECHDINSETEFLIFVKQLLAEPATSTSVSVEDTSMEKSYYDWSVRAYNPFSGEHKDSVYCMFPIVSQKLICPGIQGIPASYNWRPCLDYNIIYSYSKVMSFFNNSLDFDFTAIAFDGQTLRVANWEAIWTRSCSMSVRDINWRIDDLGFSGKLHNEVTMLIRSQGRRLKYEQRGFRVHIIDEDSIIEAMTIPLIDTESSIYLNGEYDDKYDYTHYYLGHSPFTRSLYISTHDNFPWRTRPKLPLPTLEVPLSAEEVGIRHSQSAAKKRRQRKKETRERRYMI
jgi:hypothetical protein